MSSILKLVANAYLVYVVDLDIMEKISKYSTYRVILSLIGVLLIAGAIGMELLAEDLAKVFVMPTLVAALFVGIANVSLSKKY